MSDMAYRCCKFHDDLDLTVEAIRNALEKAAPADRPRYQGYLLDAIERCSIAVVDEDGNMHVRRSHSSAERS